jgi:hypothetical protein
MKARDPARTPLLTAVQDAMLRGYSPDLTPSDPLFRLMLWQHAVCHVAMLAERQMPLIGPAYRWFVRRRWQQVVTFDVLPRAAA